MAIGTDISLVLSGGTSNANPLLSLGGMPSVVPVVSGTPNSLFDDIDSTQSDDGANTYRCVYLFNDGDDPIYDLRVWAEVAVEASEIRLGLEKASEIQRLTVQGAADGGSLTLRYDTQSFSFAHNASLAAWATNLQTALQTLTDSTGVLYFQNVTVSAFNSGTDLSVFDIMWDGNDGYRSMEPLVLLSNALTPASRTSITLDVLRAGAPINTVAPNIGLDTTPPGNVTFSQTSADEPLDLPMLAPASGFPLWIRRIVFADSEPLEGDGFTLRFSSQAVDT